MFFGYVETIRTLFSVADRTYFILIFIAKSYHFDTVLLLVYVVSKLAYPNCTQFKIKPITMYYIKEETINKLIPASSLSTFNIV